jgi:hypothetical protein
LAVAIKIGEILVSRGLITSAQLEQALTMQKRTGTRLGVSLVRLGFVDEDRLAGALGEQLRVPVVTPGMLEDVPPEVIARVPAQVAETHRIVPVRSVGRELQVCLADPQNLSRIDEIAFAIGSRIRPMLATEPAIDRALERYYGKTDIWDDTPPTPAEWKVEQSGTWRIPLLSPQPLPVVEAIAEPLMAEVEAESSPDPYERLSAVLTREDLASAISEYFATHFRNLCLLELIGGVGRFVALRRDGEVRSVDSYGTITLDNAAWVQDLVARPQVALRQRASDPHQQLLLESVGLTPQLICIVPVFDYGRLRYVLLGLGLAEEQLKAAFLEFKPYIGSIAEALRILALREQIRTRAQQPA